MKRMWIGAGLLAVLLAAGLFMGAAAERQICPGAENLRRAGQAALDGDWEKAEALTEAVRADWEDMQTLAAMMTSHENLEQIQISFAQLPAYLRADPAAYSALCAALAQELEALSQAHACTWQNFF